MARVFLTCFFLPLLKAADLLRFNCAEDAEYFTCLENQQSNKITHDIGHVLRDKQPRLLSESLVQKVHPAERCLSQRHEHSAHPPYKTA